MKTIHVKVFLKGGGDTSTDVPLSLFTELAVQIRSKGSEVVHLSDGRSLVVTGLMVLGKDFMKDSRIMVVDGDLDE